MRNEYDFSKAVKNPYVQRMKQQITINIEKDTIKYFKDLSGDTGIPYQSLINMYLTECAKLKKKPVINWK